MRRYVVRLVSTLAAVLMLCLTPLQAEARPNMAEDLNDEYWTAHGLGVGVLAIGALVTGALIPQERPDLMPLVKPTSLSLSEAALTLELIAPIPTFVSTTNQAEFIDANLTYGQAVFLAINVNHVLRLARLDSNSTLAFTVAYVASASLNRQREGRTESERTLKVPVRDVFWGVELGLATFSAHLEVQGGRRSYLSAAWGLGLGTMLGATVMAVHEERVAFVAPSKNWGVGLLGAVPGIVVPLVVGAIMGPPRPDPLLEKPLLSNIQLSPVWLSESARGLALAGNW